MWVDESGGTDTDASGPEAMTVHVEGQDYQAEVNYDVDSDGVNDTAIVEHDDGSAQAFIDSDGDGVADQYAVLDSSGHVVDQAVYDESSGSWVQSGGAEHPGGTDTHSQDDSTTGHIHADLPDGEVDAGVATIDTDHDGHNDTAIVETKDGGTMAFTDTDGDGEADVAVEIGADGSTTTYEHTGAGQWTEAESAGVRAADPASDSIWGGDGTQLLSGVAKIDSGTGQWISPN
ncbi:hypothetical protein QRX50_08645 [Amycolatopsis carbonis]|uniref:Uncharacterized protein n=1 Tax=Amycolatopsis carbonis TaxID=715471 RepID=A0A9Y2MTL8_9PSEU|nr:hypothetical protein [Amycolatopsis sp. 2-15]WIX80815.1 hypothetical protein QRX50_08645 [Amycolatopsis sp. 2-15]